MQIVIDIPEMAYDLLKSDATIDWLDAETLLDRIVEGIVLPKGHGRLIDADYLRNITLLHNFHGNNKNIVPYSDRRGYRLRQREVDESIMNAPTIIEADKEGADADCD